MALETFPDITPDYGTEPQEVVPQVARLAFGEGYSQRVGLGLNSIPEPWRLVWLDREALEKDTIVDFLKARGGKEAFYWTPIGESVPRKYTCPKWKPVPLEGGIWTITASFTEEFDLDE